MDDFQGPALAESYHESDRHCSFSISTPTRNPTGSLPTIHSDQKKKKDKKSFFRLFSSSKSKSKQADHVDPEI